MKKLIFTLALVLSLSFSFACTNYLITKAASADGSTMTEGVDVTIEADASDPDGTITRVEFYQGNTRLGEDNSSPYSYTWNNVSAGSYSLTAIAFDDAGDNSTSSAVNITVEQESGSDNKALNKPITASSFER